MQKGPGLWAPLKERTFSFRNFCAVKRIGGGGGGESVRCREDFEEREEELARDT